MFTFQVRAPFAGDITLNPTDIRDISRMYIARNAIRRLLMVEHSPATPALQIVCKQLYGKSVERLVDNCKLLRNTVKLMDNLGKADCPDSAEWLICSRKALHQFCTAVQNAQENTATLLLTAEDPDTEIQIRTYLSELCPEDIKLSFTKSPIQDGSNLVLYGSMPAAYHKTLVESQDWNSLLSDWLAAMLDEMHQHPSSRALTVNQNGGTVYIYDSEAFSIL